MARAAPSTGSVPRAQLVEAGSGSLVVRLLQNADDVVHVGGEGRQGLCSMLCSSPMSASTRCKDARRRCRPRQGMCRPHCAIRVSRSRCVFKLTVLPPVLGPVMTRRIEGLRPRLDDRWATAVSRGRAAGAAPGAGTRCRPWWKGSGRHGVHCGQLSSPRAKDHVQADEHARSPTVDVAPGSTPPRPRAPPEDAVDLLLLLRLRVPCSSLLACTTPIGSMKKVEPDPRTGHGPGRGSRS